MSSHHIVKDGQEPALLIIDSYFNEKELNQLLEWNPLVIVTDKAIERVLSLGIKVDVLYCNYIADVKNLVDSVQSDYESVFYSEEAFFEGLFSLLREKQQKSINILAGKPLTTDDWQFLEVQKGSINVVAFEIDCKKYFIEEDEFSKWLPVNSYFRITPLSDQSSFELNAAVSAIEENLYKVDEEGIIRVKNLRGNILFEEKL